MLSANCVDIIEQTLLVGTYYTVLVGRARVVWASVCIDRRVMRLCVLGEREVPSACSSQTNLSLYDDDGGGGGGRGVCVPSERTLIVSPPHCV